MSLPSRQLNMSQTMAPATQTPLKPLQPFFDNNPPRIPVRQMGRSAIPVNLPRPMADLFCPSRPIAIGESVSEESAVDDRREQAPLHHLLFIRYPAEFASSLCPIFWDHLGMGTNPGRSGAVVRQTPGLNAGSMRLAGLAKIMLSENPPAGQPNPRVRSLAGVAINFEAAVE